MINVKDMKVEKTGCEVIQWSLDYCADQRKQHHIFLKFTYC